MKRFLFLCLTALSLYLPSFAYDAVVDGIYYNLNDDGTAEVTYIKYGSKNNSEAYTGSIEIPSSVKYEDTEYTVTSIGDGAFNHCSSLTSVKIPDSVTCIGDTAFYDCSKLTEVTIPNSVTSIGGEAFAYCSNLTSVTIPNSVMSIEDYTFFNCSSLAEVTIGNSVTSIGSRAFQECSSLTSVSIGNSVTSIGEYAFLNCSGLTEITSLNPEPPTCTSSTFTEVDTKNCILYVPTGSKEAYEDADYWSVFTNIVGIDPNCVVIDGIYYDLEEDGDTRTAEVVNGAYSGEVVIPSTVTYNETTYNVTSIGDTAFYNCTNLTKLSIPSSVTSIGSKAFAGCTSLTDFILEDGTATLSISLDGNPVDGCPVSSLYLGRTALSISSGNLGTLLSILNNISSLTSLTIGKYFTSYSSYFYYLTSLQDIEVAEGNETYCSVDGVLYTKDMKTLVAYPAAKDSTFAIPASVTSIVSNAFKGSSLTEITSLNTTPPTCTSSSFTGVDQENCTLYVPAGTKEKYEAAEEWSNFTNIVELPSEGEVIEDGQNSYVVIPDDSGKPSLELKAWDKSYTGELTVPSEITKDGVTYTITSIADSAFMSCSGITKLTIPGTVTSIGRHAFYLCINITEITIINNITIIGDFAFQGCEKLQKIVVPKSVTDIGEGAFRDCPALENIDVDSDNEKYLSQDGVLYNKDQSELICVPAAGPSGKFTVPSTVTHIWDYSFQLNVNITEITISSNVTIVGGFAFRGSEKLQKIAFPKAVTEIGEGAFTDCPALEDIEVDDENEHYCSEDGVLYNKDKSELICMPAGKTHDGEFEIPSTVTKIGSYAFYLCVNITKITIVNNITVIGKQAFGGCTSLREMTMASPEPPTCEEDAFDGIDKDSVTLYVPLGSKQKYEAADVWKGFTHIVEVTEIEVEGNLYVFILKEDGSLELELNTWDKSFTGELEIPGEITKGGATYNVTSIADSAFVSCEGLTRVTVPSTVTSIGKRAFYLCINITEITIVNNITVIGEFAFQGCDKLRKVVVPKSVEEIGEGAFRDCPALESIEVDEDNGHYLSEDGALYTKDKSELICVPAAGPSGKFTVPSTVTRVWSYSFQLNVNITEVTISNNVTVIGDFAFQGCDKLRRVYIPGSVEEIGEGAFRECPALECLEVDETNESFCSRDSVLYSKDMKELLRMPAGRSFEGGFMVPSSVTTIERYAFYLCVNITRVTIERNVTVIGKLAFGGCEGLREIASVNPEPPVCEPDAFDGVDKDSVTLYVPQGSKQKYAAADVWKDFPNIVEDAALGLSSASAYDDGQVVSRYTLDGRQASAPQRGLNIVRYANGTTKKVLVK